MHKTAAVIIELALFVCALWAVAFLSTLMHEVGHALGYMIATGDGHWHIRVGSGKRLLDTRKLTVKLLPFDGCFTPSDTNKIDTTGKLVMTLSGGPVASLVLVIGLLLLKLGVIPFHSEIITPSAIESFANSALSLNLFILVLSVIPTHYFHGEIKGMETDGLQILNAIRKNEG